MSRFKHCYHMHMRMASKYGPFSQLRDAWYDATKWPIARGTTEGSATQQAYKVYGRPSCGLWDVPHVVCLLLG